MPSCPETTSAVKGRLIKGVLHQLSITLLSLCNVLGLTMDHFKKSMLQRRLPPPLVKNLAPTLEYGVGHVILVVANSGRAASFKQR